MPRARRIQARGHADANVSQGIRDAWWQQGMQSGAHDAYESLIDGAELITYEGAPHGMTDTHKDRLNTDLLEFLRK